MSNIKNFALLLLFLTAFSICSVAQQTAKADFQKKIAEATPTALPQSPVAGKLKSDAQDKNLKGKVKSVIEHAQEGTKGARQLYSEEYFNEDGNLIKEISYIDGYPNSVTVWGYIDGNRVNKTGYIQYTEKERPSTGRMLITVAAEDNVLNPNAPKDERYEIKHTYKYNEQGQLIEDWRYQNNGEVWARVVYNYKGNQREVSRYGQDGSRWSRTIEILDNDGNVIEEKTVYNDGKIEDGNVYTYEFDSQKNWIVQKTFERKKVKGKAVQKLLWTSYRTITYYP